MSPTSTIRTALPRWPSPARCAKTASLLLAVTSAIGLLGCGSGTPEPPGGERDEQPVAWHSDGAVTRADGVLPDSVTVFDDDVPGIANLDPDLLSALRDAARAAAEDGVSFGVHSAWRSPEYQKQLLDEAVHRYGSRSKAARWVATPRTSPHVSGDAIDLESRASAWLSRFGASYGLCRIYLNEPWHYERRPVAIGHRCPKPYANPTKDPRMK
jgi:hypothetical protein